MTSETGYCDAMSELHEEFKKLYPLKSNPCFDENEPICEQLILCRCGAQYRVLVNGNPPIADAFMKELDICCGNCGLHASEAVMVSGHSAGVFNASITFGRNR